MQSKLQYIDVMKRIDFLCDMEPNFKGHTVVMAFRIVNHWNRRMRPEKLELSQRFLGWMMNTTDQNSVRYWIKNLLDVGFLEVVKKGKKSSSIYKIRDVKNTSDTTSDSTSDTTSESTSDTTSESTSDTTSDSTSDTTSIYRDRERERETEVEKEKEKKVSPHVETKKKGGDGGFENLENEIEKANGVKIEETKPLQKNSAQKVSPQVIEVQQEDVPHENKHEIASYRDFANTYAKKDYTPEETALEWIKIPEEKRAEILQYVFVYCKTIETRYLKKPLEFLKLKVYEQQIKLSTKQQNDIEHEYYKGLNREQKRQYNAAIRAKLRSEHRI